MTDVPLNLDKALIGAPASYTWRVQISNNYGEVILNERMEKPNLIESDESIANDTTLTLPFKPIHVDLTDITNNVLPGSTVEIFVNVEVYWDGAMIVHEERKFVGRIKSISCETGKTTLKIRDPLGDLAEQYYNYESKEATTLKVVSDVNDPTRTVPGIEHEGATLVPVTEGEEERWILPSEIDANPVYQNSYVGGVSDDAYSGTYNYGSGTFNFVAGSNRRTWKIVSNVYDSGMSLSISDPPLEYPKPIPPNRYVIGSDVGNYLQFLDYTPVGLVYVEWVVMYVEGTNQIEDVIKHLVNPKFTGRAIETLPDTTFLKPGFNSLAKQITKLGVIENLTTTTVGTILRVLPTHIETDITWSEGDEFEIRDSVDVTPIWKEGVHYDSSGTYDERTIWPSGITVNLFTWNAKQGSILDAIQKVQNELCPPNYRIVWDYKLDRLRMQFMELTPHDPDSPYYGQAFGKLRTPYADDATDHIILSIGGNATFPVDLENFASAVLIEGVNENPRNLIQVAGQVYSQPPGDAVSGWTHNSGDLPGEWTTSREFDDHVHQNYPGPGGNLLDMNFDTFFAWEQPNGIDKGEDFAKTFIFDALEIVDTPIIAFYTLPSLRPFPFRVRIEVCKQDGVLLDSGQYKFNDDAEWQLAHTDYYDKSVDPWHEVFIDSGWLTPQFRFVRISMTWAKTHGEKWSRVGVADFRMYKRLSVSGTAKIADLTDYMTREIIGGIGSTTILDDSNADFIAEGVSVGDIVRIDATEATVISVDSSTQLTTTSIAPESYSAGQTYFISKPVGGWLVYPSSDTDGATALLHLPKLDQQMRNSQSGAYSVSADSPKSNQLVHYDEDRSLSTSNMCMRRAQQTLIETLREFKVTGATVKLHPGLSKYQTVVLFHPRLNITFKGMVTGIRWNAIGMCDIDGTFYADGAWTGEVPLPI